MRKHLSIALLAFSIAMITANSLAKKVHHFLRPQAGEEVAENSFFPFAATSQSNYVKVYETEAEYEAEKAQNATEDDLQQTKEFIQPILKMELTDEEKQVVTTYAQNDKLKAFITELSTVISPEELHEENYLKIAFKPEVRDIFMKYARDEEFRDVATTVMKDKNVLELAKKIIQNNEVKK